MQQYYLIFYLTQGLTLEAVVTNFLTIRFIMIYKRPMLYTRLALRFLKMLRNQTQIWLQNKKRCKKIHHTGIQTHTRSIVTQRATNELQW